MCVCVGQTSGTDGDTVWCVCDRPVVQMGTQCGVFDRPVVQMGTQSGVCVCVTDQWYRWGHSLVCVCV